MGSSITDIMSEKFNSQKAPEPVGLYPHARKVGELLFLSVSDQGSVAQR